MSDQLGRCGRSVTKPARAECKGCLRAMLRATIIVAQQLEIAMQYEFLDTDAEAQARVAQHKKAGRCAYAMLLCRFGPGGYEVRSWK